MGKASEPPNQPEPDSYEVLDKETARRNEEGENAHSLYKERQRATVSSRLKKGARYKR